MAQGLLLDVALRDGMEQLSQSNREGALQTFHEAVVSRQKGSVSTLDDIMRRHVSLCVDLENFKLLREVLPIYRNMVQINSPQSLKDLLDYLQECTSGKVNDSPPETLAGIEDLDGEGDLTTVLTQLAGRSDASALKFLWETYKLSVDLLKTNGKLIDTYRSMATKALQFCQKHTRKLECIRLCETLRVHLINVIKNHRNNTTTGLNYLINLDDEETVRSLMRLKTIQIDICLQLNLFQEAYKAIEDAYQLSLLQETLTPQFKSNYYHMIATIMLKGRHWQCHSYVYFLYLNLNLKMNKGLTPADRTEMCTVFLLSALAIPPQASPETELINKLEVLLWDAHVPDRTHLLDKLAVGILPFVHSWAKELYTLLHTSCLPKELVSRFKDLMPSLEAFPAYLRNIQQLVIGKVVERLAQSYTSITFSSFTKILDFLPFAEIEAHIVELSKKSSLHIAIDKARQAFFFREHNRSLVHRLAAAHQLLNECLSSAQAQEACEEREAQRIEYVQSIYVHLAREKEAFQEKQQSHQQRAEEKKTQQRLREQEEKKDEEERRKQQELQQKDREKTLKIEKSKEQIAVEKRKIYLEAIHDIMQKMLRGGFHPKDMKVDGRRLEEMDDDQLLEVGIPKLEALYQRLLDKSAKEREALIKKRQQKLEYWERAKRETLIPMLLEEWSRSVEDEAESKKRLLRDKHEADLNLKQQIMRVKSHKDEYVTEISEQANQMYNESLRQWENSTMTAFKKQIVEMAKEKAAREVKRQKEREEEKKRKAEADKKQFEEKRMGWRQANVTAVDRVENKTPREEPTTQKRFSNTKREEERKNEGFRNFLESNTSTNVVSSGGAAATRGWRNEESTTQSSFRNPGNTRPDNKFASSFRNTEGGSSFRRNDTQGGFRRNDNEGTMKRNDNQGWPTARNEPATGGGGGGFRRNEPQPMRRNDEPAKKQKQKKDEVDDDGFTKVTK